MCHVRFSNFGFFEILERALRALASSSGGTACPLATRGQPQESGGDSKAIEAKKKFCDGRTNEGRMDEQMDRQT